MNEKISSDHLRLNTDGPIYGTKIKERDEFMMLSNVRMYQQMFKEYPDAVNFEQFRNMLGLGKNRAYDLLRSGEIPCRRNGKKYIIAKIHIIEFLTFNEKKSC